MLFRKFSISNLISKHANLSLKKLAQQKRICTQITTAREQPKRKMQDRAFGHTDRSATEARIGVAEMPEALLVVCSTGGGYSCRCSVPLSRSTQGGAVRELGVGGASSVEALQAVRSGSRRWARLPRAQELQAAWSGSWKRVGFPPSKGGCSHYKRLDLL